MFGWVNRSFLKAALIYCQDIINDQMVETDADDELDDIMTEHRHDEFFKRNCFKANYKLSNNLKEILYMYSSFDLPYTSLNMEFVDKNKLNLENGYEESRN